MGGSRCCRLPPALPVFLSTGLQVCKVPSLPHLETRERNLAMANVRTRNKNSLRSEKGWSLYHARTVYRNTRSTKRRGKAETEDRRKQSEKGKYTRELEVHSRENEVWNHPTIDEKKLLQALHA